MSESISVISIRYATGKITLRRVFLASLSFPFLNFFSIIRLFMLILKTIALIKVNTIN